jgi:hypothetical protein
MRRIIFSPWSEHITAPFEPGLVNAGGEEGGVPRPLANPVPAAPNALAVGEFAGLVLWEMARRVGPGRFILPELQCPRLERRARKFHCSRPVLLHPPWI